MIKILQNQAKGTQKTLGKATGVKPSVPFSHSDKPVNVASVPQRSPFRYPGGKTWLVPRIRQWLGFATPQHIVEPFAGGGIVSLTAVAENLVPRATMVELDEQVAAVWQTIFCDDAKWLIKKIGDFDISVDTVLETLDKKPRSTRDVAFQTILKNRTYHGGILARGSAPIKNGENGKGISSRWYPATLQRRIGAIYEIRDRIDFIHGDGLEVMEKFSQAHNSAFFIDPPYTAAGKRAGRRLYTYCELNHDALFQLSADVVGDVLLTYDNADGVREMAARHGLNVHTVAMQNTHLSKMNELLIGKNLVWVGE